MRLFFLAALLATVAGCGRDPEPPPALPPKPDLPPPAEVKPNEDFAKDEYPELAPGGPVTCAWNLAADVHHTYGFEQESFGLFDTRARDEAAKIRMRSKADGGAEFVGAGQGRGELFFKSSPRAQWINDQPVSGEELNKIQPDIFQFLLREDGTITSTKKLKGATNYAMLDLYFALPSKPLGPGETDTREIHVDGGPEDFKYHGRQEIAHAGRRRVGGAECVKLLSKIDLELTPYVDGRGRLVGCVAGYFDPAARRFVRVEASLALAVDLRKLLRPQDPTIAPYWNLLSTQYHTRVTITSRD